MIKIIKNIYNNQYAFSIISKILGVLIGFAFSIVYNRYFGPEMTGEISVITNYLGMLYIFLCMGMYQAYPYYRKELSESEVSNYYKSFVNDTMGLFIIYIAISIFLISIIEIEFQYKLVILLLPTEFLIKQFNYIVLIENPKLRNMTGIKLSLFEFMFVIALMITVQSNYRICIFFIIVKQIVILIFSIENLKISLIDIRPSFSKNIIKFMRFGFIPMLSTLLMTANYKLDILMLDYFDNVSSVDIGIYSLGVSLAERIWMIPDALKDILLSKLSKGTSEKEVAKVIRISLPLIGMFILGILFLGQPFITIIYGSKFSSAYDVTVLIMFGIVCMVFYKMINSYYIIEGLKFRSFFMLAVTAMINIILNIIFIPLYGMIGAALASLISYVLCGIMFVVTFKFRTKIGLSELFLIKKDDVQQIINKLIR